MGGRLRVAFRAIPNLLTSLRLVLCPVIAYFVLTSHFATALILFILACLSDYWDGYLARRLDSITSLGRFMDPIADKVITFTFFTILMAKGICPPWFLALVITSNLLQALGYAVVCWTKGQTKILFEPLFISKLNAALQFAWIGILLLDCLLQAVSPANPPLNPWVRGIAYTSLSLLQVGVFFSYFFTFRQHLALDIHSLTAPS